MAGLSDTLWGDITDVYDAILAHPFLTGVVDGTLDEGAFRHYVVQDAHYLRDFARALATVGARAHEEADIQLFCQHADNAIAVERALHSELLGELGIDAAAAAKEPMAPTTLAYTSYILATCHLGSFTEGLAAVLPCYWIYWEVGRELAAKGSADARYQKWIDAYASEDFGEVVRAALEVCDRVGEEVSAAERDRMRTHFQRTARYEWMFWDAGYRQEAWPV